MSVKIYLEMTWCVPKYNILSLRSAFLKSALFFLVFFIVEIAVSQDIYRTQDGNMLVTVVCSDTVLTLSTKKMSILLNNSTAKFNLTIDKSTFVTSNDSINRKLAALKAANIEFSGKLGVETINRNNHAPIDFDVEGVFLRNNKTIRGTGRLEHISPEGDISCLLTLKFHLHKDDLGFELDGLNLSDEVQIDIVQVLLNN